MASTGFDHLPWPTFSSMAGGNAVFLKDPSRKELYENFLEEELQWFDEGQAERVRALVRNGEDPKHVYSGGKTALHVLFDAFPRENGKAQRRVLQETVKTLVALGTDATARDDCKRSVFCLAVECSCPTEILDFLLSHGVSIDVDSDDSRQVLVSLLKCEKCFTKDYLEYLIGKGANVEAAFYDDNLPENLANNLEMFTEVCFQYYRGVLEKNAYKVLRWAVEVGSVETVEFLLEKKFVDKKGCSEGAPLAVVVAKANYSPDKMFGALLSCGASIGESDTKGRNVMHYAAEGNRLDVMKSASEYDVEFDKRDVDDNLPIHIACQSNERLECLEYLISIDSASKTISAKNGKDKSCLCLAITEKAELCAQRLVMADADLEHDKSLKHLDYDELRLLCDETVIGKAPRRVEALLRMSRLMIRCSHLDTLHRSVLKSLSNQVQKRAVKRMDRSGWTESDITDDLLDYALQTKQKLFVASALVQKRLDADWFGHNKKLYTTQYISKVACLLLASFLAPILWLCGFKGTCNQCRRSESFKKYVSSVEPCIRYLANVVSYLFFIILLIVNVSLKSNADSPLETLSVLDWTILVFVFALVVQELRQAFGYFEKKSFVVYAQNWSNIVDCVLILSFVLYYLLLFVGYYGLTEKFEVIRISFHVFGVCCLISCVRFVWYLQAHPLLGPIQVSFVEIFYVVVQFLVILGTLMVGFSICITSVYSATAKGPGAATNATAPDAVAGTWSSLRTLFWSLFGMIDLESFESDKGAETAVGLSILAMWLVLAVIILLNMLIALISTALQKVQDNAEIEWKFARAVIIQDIRKSPPTPIPINILTAIRDIFRKCCGRGRTCCKASENREAEEVEHGKVGTLQRNNTVPKKIRYDDDDKRHAAPKLTDQLHFHENFEDHQTRMCSNAEISEIKEETAQLLLRELRDMKLLLRDIQRRDIVCLGSQ